MNSKIIISLFSAIAFIIPNLCSALPAPCTQEELLQSSDFAIEGTVTKVACGTPYKSEQCTAKNDDDSFVPELLADCKATVKVTKNIKGNYEAGDEATIPYIQLVQHCNNGNHIIPGSPVKDFVPNSVIKYYSSQQCKYWNYIKISTPPVSH